MISIPIPTWSMCVCSEFVKRLIPSVERVGLRAFEALAIGFVNQSLRGGLPGDPPQPPLKRGENKFKVPLVKGDGDLGGSTFMQETAS
jgi:hypothetical protein